MGGNLSELGQKGLDFCRSPRRRAIFAHGALALAEFGAGGSPLALCFPAASNL